MISQRVRGYLSGLLFGLIVAWLIAAVVAKFWPEARSGVFLTLVVIWLSGFVYVLARDIAAGGERERAVFIHPEKWDPADLPREFRFITHHTTVQEALDKLGPCTRVTGTGLVRFDLPSGGALFIFPETPFSNSSNVQGIQLYRTENDVPPFG